MFLLSLNKKLFSPNKKKVSPKFSAGRFKKKSFSLIEVIIVITIIAILAAVILAYMGQSKKVARDTTRIAQLNQLKTTLVWYYTNLKEYPKSEHPVCIEKDKESGGSIFQILIDNNYLSDIPKDPLYQEEYNETQEHCYIYLTDETGQHFKMLVKLEILFDESKNDGGLYDDYYEVYSPSSLGATLAYEIYQPPEPTQSPSPSGPNLFTWIFTKFLDWNEGEAQNTKVNQDDISLEENEISQNATASLARGGVDCSGAQYSCYTSPSYINDGNISTGNGAYYYDWETGEYGPIWQLEWQNQQEISKVSIMWGKHTYEPEGSPLPGNFYFQYWNGSTWQTPSGWQSNSCCQTFDVWHNFPLSTPITTTKIRVIVPGYGGDIVIGGGGLKEWKVFSKSKYKNAGFYTSILHDSHSDATNWQELAFDKGETQSTIQVRAGNTSDLSGISWSDEQDGSTIDLSTLLPSSARYIQYKINFQTNNYWQTPYVLGSDNSIKIAGGGGVVWLENNNSAWQDGTFENSQIDATNNRILLTESDGKYSLSGSYTSNVYDAGSSINWLTLQWKKITQENIDEILGQGNISLQLRTRYKIGELPSDWWNTNWYYRKPITISNSGNDLQDYQIKFNVAYDPDMQSDFDDLRFIDPNGAFLSEDDSGDWTSSEKSNVDINANNITLYYESPGIEYFYDFEDGMQGWTTGYSTGHSWSRTNTICGAGLGTNAMVDEHCGAWVDNWIKSPILDLSSSDNSSLSLKVWQSDEDGGCYGEAWTDSKDLRVCQDNGSGGVTNCTRLSCSWTNDGAWHQYNYNISAYDGLNNVVLMLRYNTGDEIGGSGWAIDDVLVQGEGGGSGTYQTPGYYVSNIYDAGSEKTWETLNWNFNKPANTNISIKVRAGNTSDLAGVSWSSAYTTSPVTLSGIVGRYLQYKVDLSTSDTSQTPTLNSVQITPTNSAKILSYWIESKTDGESADIWVKVPTIPSGTKKIYIYYGNDSAILVSNGNNTFDFFDDFNNLNKWTQSGSNVTVSNSIVTLDSGTNPTIYTNFTAPSPFIVEAKYQHPSNYRNRLYLTTSSGTGSPTGYDYGIFNPSIFWNGWTGVNLNANTWYILRWENTSSNYTWRILNYPSETEIISRSHGSAIAGLSRIYFSGTESTNSDFKLDWVRVRRYASSIPNYQFGDEEGDYSWSSWSSEITSSSISDLQAVLSNPQARFIQYKVNFSSPAVGITPFLHSVKLGATDCEWKEDNQGDWQDGTSDNTEIGAKSIYLIYGKTSGTYISNVYDSDSDSTIWQTLNWDSLRKGQKLYLQTRVKSENFLAGWSFWTDLNDESPINLGLFSDNRYIQYRAIFETTEANFTPVLTEVRIKGEN